MHTNIIRTELTLEGRKMHLRGYIVTLVGTGQLKFILKEEGVSSFAVTEYKYDLNEFFLFVAL